MKILFENWRKYLDEEEGLLTESVVEEGPLDWAKEKFAGKQKARTQKKMDAVPDKPESDEQPRKSRPTVYHPDGREEGGPDDERARSKCKGGSLGDLLNKMKKLHDIERQGKGEELAASLAGTAADLVPVVGDVKGKVEAANDMVNLLITAKGVMSGEYAEDKVTHEAVSDFPILARLKVDPALVQWLDNDVLAAFDDDYVKEVLMDSKYTPDTCMEKIPDINSFIRSKISGVCKAAQKLKK